MSFNFEIAINILKLNSLIFKYKMFKLRNIEIDAKHNYIAIMLEEDANELGFKPQERVKITCSKSKREVICELDIVDYKRKKGAHKDVSLKKGEIGVFENAFHKINGLEGNRVKIISAAKPKSLDYVRNKFNGHKLSDEQFLEIAQDIVSNKFSEIETTFFVLACTAHSLNDNEVIGLTKAMVNVGKELNFKGSNNIIVDKHCIGGIPNNRTTMIITPIIAAAGLKIPKTSSRSITSPAGTADTMEVLAHVDIPLSKMNNIVNEIGGCIVWGGGLDLSPADDIIIHVEHPLELDSEGQMIASILSKKKSAGSTHVVIDIPVGKTAKVTSREHAELLANRFEKVGKAIGLKIKVILTDGSEPIGNGVGPLKEVEDVLAVLNNLPGAPEDLKQKSLMLAGEILELAKVAKRGKGFNMAEKILDSFMAKDKFEEILDAQGRKEELPKAKFTIDIKAKGNGKVKHIHNKKISKLAFILGAPEDPAGGLYLHKKVLDNVEAGEILYTLYSNSKAKMNYAEHFIDENLDIFEF